MVRPRFRVLVMALGLVALLPGPGSADTVAVKAAGSPGNWTWSPDVRHSAPGDKVVWKNPTKKVHTVTAYGGNWSKRAVLQPGERTAKTFSSLGSYYYRCTRHSEIHDGECHGMCGYVHVMN